MAIKEMYNMGNAYMLKPLIKHTGDYRCREFYKTLPLSLQVSFEDGLIALYGVESMKAIFNI